MKNHIKNFIKNLNIKKDVVIGVSGGVDSMLLLYIMNKLGFDIQAIHINHNTRPENFKEEELVRNYCDKIKVPLKVFNFFFNEKDGNFEAKAREYRYMLFNEEKKTILTAHHIDDSFEWHLMQKFKSSGETLGIPVKNKNIVRPFMCLTKEQIYKLAKKYNVPYMEDSSNLNTDYERNFMRQTIIPQIKKKYPNYLEKYVHQMNIRSKELNLHFTQNKNKLIKMSESSINLQLNASHREIEEALKTVSNGKRGKFSRNIISMINAIEKGKKDFEMTFSGGAAIKIMKDKLVVFQRFS